MGNSRILALEAVALEDAVELLMELSFALGWVVFFMVTSGWVYQTFAFFGNNFL